MKKLLLFIIIIMIIHELSLCQSNRELVEDSIFLYLNVDISPHPILEKDIESYVMSRFKWPNEFGGEGKVIISFIVNTDGSLDQFKIEKGLYNRIEKQCIEILKKMPPWKPGKIDNRNVKVRVYLPLKFQLTK